MKGLLWVIAFFTACISLAGGFVGIVTFYYWWDVRHHRPCQFDVNLSEVGEYSGPYRRYYSAPHGLQLRIEVSPPFQSNAEMEKALEGVECTFSVGAPGAEDYRRKTFSAADFGQRKHPGCTACARMNEHTPFVDLERVLNGNWSGEARLVVEKPAPGLKGRKQTLSLVHLYCVTESGLNQIFAGVVLLVAFICGIVSFRIGRGLRSDQQSPQKTPGGPHAPPDLPARAENITSS